MSVRNLEINLGKACNNRCVFCSNDRVTREERRWMKLEQVAGELDRGRQRGFESLGFIGGEPTRYARIADAVALAREKGFTRVSLCTNGSGLADATRLDDLLTRGVTRVALSIHSHRAALEDAITRRPGSFDEKLRAIDQLVAARDAGRLPHGFSLNTVLHKKNVDALEGLVVFFRKRGVTDIRFNFIRPVKQARGNPEWVPTLSHTATRLQRVIAKNETVWKQHLTFADIPLCQYPWELLANPALRRFYIGEYRDLDTDVSHARPGAPQDVERFNWKEQRLAQLKTYVAPCDDCPLRPLCEGVWREYLDIHGTAEFDDGPRLARAGTS